MLYLIVPDMAMMQELNERQAEAYNGYASVIQFNKGFDLDADADTQLAIQAELEQQLSEEGCVCESRESGRSSFYALYGGLLFLGILLSVVFLFGTVLIMYYKAANTRKPPTVMIANREILIRPITASNRYSIGKANARCTPAMSSGAVKTVKICVLMLRLISFFVMPTFCRISNRPASS